MTVSELLDRIDSRELSEWIAYYAIEPFGEERGDLRMQRICQVTAQIAVGKKGRKPKLEDFALFDDKPEQTPQEQMAMFRNYTAMMGGSVS